MVMSGQRGFWDVEERLRALSRRGDPLEKLQATVDFEMFRRALSRAVGLGARPKGARPPSTWF
jgi:transposase, IS5 family